MSEPLILALDQGTTSTRAVLFNARGEAIAEAGRPLQQHYPQDGWVEHDAVEIYEAAVETMRAALEKAGVGAEAVRAIGVTNQRETVVVWDKATGQPIHRAVVWQDRRTADACDALRRRGVEPRVTEITGLLLDPYFSGTKLAWLLDNVPGARRRAEGGELLAGTIDCWLIWKLTGGQVHATDATNASRTLLFDLRGQRWSEEMLRLLNVPANLLPQVFDCSGHYGETEPGLLGCAVPIRGVAGDQQAALMGQGCVHPGEMKATYGTGCFILVNTGTSAPRSRSRLLATVAARVGGRTTYALEGSIFIAGAAIQWLCEGLGLESAAAAEKLAQTARSGHGVMMTPAFTGLGAPWWDPEARGAIFGLTRDSGRAEIADAAFAACALQSRDLIEAMRADAPHAFQGGVEMRIDGGMSRSAWFAQRLADLTGLTVSRASYVETTALGAALFAGLGAGVYDSLEAAAKARPSAETLHPEIEASARERAYARWLGVINRIRT